MDNENVCINNDITWPFWIQFLTLIIIQITLALASKGNWLALCLYLPHISLGIIGLIMNRKMKRLRVATIVLSIVNLILSVLSIFCALFVLSVANYGIL